MRTRSEVLIAVSLFSLMILTAGGGLAATGDHIMSRGFPAAGEVALDGSDHIVTHGAFFGGIDLGGGTLTSVNFFDGDQYLARFDASGNHLWSLQFTPNGYGISDELVAADPAGNIYITGALFSGCDINYGGGSLVGPGVYVAKFNSSGVHQWSAVYGSGTPKSIAANNTHVVLTGYTSTGLDFGGGTVGNAGGYDVFVGQLTAAGAHSWSSGFGDAGDQGGMSVALDGSGNVIVAGSMFGTVNFGGGGLVANALDLFVARFSSSGVHSWSHVFDGLFTPGGGILITTDVAAGPSGEVAITGEMRNGVDFGGGTITSSGFSDIYVARFDAAGAHQWSAVYGNAGGSDIGRSVAIDGSGDVLVTGRFYDDTDFGGGIVAFDGDPLNFDSNIFTALYDSSGTHLFSDGWGQKPLYASNHFDSGDQIVIYGYSSASINFGGGAISPADLFVARLEGVSGPTTAIGDTPAHTTADMRAYPNPFNPVTTIEYFVDSPGNVTVAIFDVRGHLVEELVANQWHARGRYLLRYEAGASGVYFARLHTAHAEGLVKLVAVK